MANPIAYFHTMLSQIEVRNRCAFAIRLRYVWSRRRFCQKCHFINTLPSCTLQLWRALTGWAAVVADGSFMSASLSCRRLHAVVVYPWKRPDVIFVVDAPRWRTEHFMGSVLNMVDFLQFFRALHKYTMRTADALYDYTFSSSLLYFRFALGVNHLGRYFLWHCNNFVRFSWVYLTACASEFGNNFPRISQYVGCTLVVVEIGAIGKYSFFLITFYYCEMFYKKRFPSKPWLVIIDLSFVWNYNASVLRIISSFELKCLSGKH